MSANENGEHDGEARGAEAYEDPVFGHLLGFVVIHFQ